MRRKKSNIEYCIQKLSVVSQRPGNWLPAFGHNLLSYPKADSDADAISLFKEITSSYKIHHRLIKFVGSGYRIKVVVLCSNEEDFSERKKCLLD